MQVTIERNVKNCRVKVNTNANAETLFQMLRAVVELSEIVPKVGELMVGGKIEMVQSMLTKFYKDMVPGKYLITTWCEDLDKVFFAVKIPSLSTEIPEVGCTVDEDAVLEWFRTHP